MKKVSGKILIMTLAVALVMMLGTTGCGGKTPEASELLKSLGTSTDNMEATMTLHLKAITDGSEMGIDGTMEIGLDADLTIQQQKDLSHTNGTMSMNMFGMNFDQTLDQWVDESGDVIRTYSYDTEEEEWTVEESDKEDAEPGIGVPDISEDMFSQLEVKKDGKQYVLTGTIDPEKLWDTEIGSLFEGVANEDTLNEMEMKAELRFNSKDNSLEKMVLSANADSGDEGKVEFEIGIEIKSTGNVKLTLPDGFEDLEPIDYYDMFYDEDYDLDTDWDESYDYDFESDADVTID